MSAEDTQTIRDALDPANFIVQADAEMAQHALAALERLAAENERLRAALAEILRDAHHHHQWWSQEKARAALAGNAEDTAEPARVQATPKKGPVT